MSANSNDGSDGFWQVLTNSISTETTFSWGPWSSSASEEPTMDVVMLSKDGQEPFELEEILTIVDTVDIDLSGLFILAEVISLLCTLYLLIAFVYVRRINREENVKPDWVHRFFCPLLTVLRWEGFDGHEPLYALVFGNIYTLFWWTPTSEEDQHTQTHTATSVDGYTQMEEPCDNKTRLLTPV